MNKELFFYICEKFFFVMAIIMFVLFLIMLILSILDKESDEPLMNKKLIICFTVPFVLLFLSFNFKSIITFFVDIAAGENAGESKIKSEVSDGTLFVALTPIYVMLIIIANKKK